MKKIILLPIILGSVLLVGGAAITIMAARRISNSSGVAHIQNTYDIEEEFTSFKAELSTANYEIKLASDGKVKVECDEKKKQHHDVKVVDNTLQVTLVDERRWYERWFDWDFRNMQITVYVPEKAYENIDIKVSTGNIKIPNSVSFKNMDVKASTGNVRVDADVEEKINSVKELLRNNQKTLILGDVDNVAEDILVSKNTLKGITDSFNEIKEYS